MTPVEIIAFVCRRCNVPIARMHDGRTRTVVDARSIASWLLRLRGLSYSAIGRALLRNHSTVLHHMRRVEETPALLETAIDLAWELEAAGDAGARKLGGHQRAL